MQDYEPIAVQRKPVNLLHKPTFDRILSQFTLEQQKTLEAHLPLQPPSVCVQFWRLAIYSPGAAMRYLNIESNYIPTEPEIVVRRARQRLRRSA